MPYARVFHEKAAHYRELAAGLLTKTDPTRLALLAMAEEFEAKAAEAEAGDDQAGE